MPHVGYGRLTATTADRGPSQGRNPDQDPQLIRPQYFVLKVKAEREIGSVKLGNWADNEIVPVPKGASGQGA